MGERLAITIDFYAAVLRAQSLVSEALELLDETNAPAQIGAHLDMALHCMSRVLPPE